MGPDFLGGCALPFIWSEIASKISVYNETDKLELLINEGREFYQSNYTSCYTCISTQYEFSYFEISVSKQSYTGIFSIIIMLVTSE